MKPKMMMLALVLAGGCGAAGAATARQDSPQAAPPVEPAVVAPAPAAGGWVPLSRSALRVYLIDPSKIRHEGDVTTVAVARTRRDRAAPDDYSYDVDELELRCGSRESRATTSIAYGPDGVETDRYEDPSPWSAIAPETLDDFASGVACTGDQMTGTRWATIQAFMDAGQP